MHVWSRPQAISCAFLRHRAVCLCVSLHLLFSVPVYNKGRELGTREFMYNSLKAFYLSSDVFFMSSHHLDKTGNGMSFCSVRSLFVSWAEGVWDLWRTVVIYRRSCLLWNSHPHLGSFRFKTYMSSTDSESCAVISALLVTLNGINYIIKCFIILILQYVLVYNIILL